MLLGELKRLVAKGENIHLEFKRKANFPDKIMKEVVAFANTEGGKLLIGVDDNGSIAGLKHVLEEEFVLKEAIAKYCKPAIKYDISKVLVSPNRFVLVFHIYPSEVKPIFLIYNFKTNIGKAYVRVKDKSIQASKEMRQILKARSKNADTYLQYGENQHRLMQYLAQNPSINVETFSKVADISPKEASDILVKMTLAGVICIFPDDLGDYFTMNENQ
ncbi:MAG: ATP-binding protein [Thermoflexibacter sp.]|jgi:predicted HTH transcriptional regulator|nr:ATP-binding protein [Thermoflexibacter sp.]